MLLLGTNIVVSAFGLLRGATGRAAQRGLRHEVLTIVTLQNYFANLCKACQLRTMSCIPPSAFSAGRIRDTQRDRDMKLSNTNKGRAGEQGKFFDTTFMELSPLKYNSKLMNSIWGFYNRYSPHNVKKIDKITFPFNVECQSPQAASNSTNKTEAKVTLPSTSLDNVWAAVNIPQSH